MTNHTPWSRRYTGGPRSIAALMTGVSTWLGWTIVIIVAGREMAWQALVWWSAVAAFNAAVVITPLAYAGLKLCYDRPPKRAGENVRREPVREWSGPRRPSDFEERYEQTRAGRNPAWRERAVPSLPAGITRRELEDWLFDARDERATFAARDSRRGEGGRSRQFASDMHPDDITSNVKAWLDLYGVIDVDGSGQWQWGEMADPLFEALLRGEGFEVLVPPTDEEV